MDDEVGDYGTDRKRETEHGDAQKQKAQADQCLGNGAKVLIEVPEDSGSAAAIEKTALAKGVPSIDYDRQVIGGVAKIYDSFDGKAVGVLQGKGVVAGLKAIEGNPFAPYFSAKAAEVAPADFREPEAAARLLTGEVLKGLDRRVQEIAVYVFVDGMTHAEAAEVAGVSERTVRNCLSRFLAHGRERLGLDLGKEGV